MENAEMNLGTGLIAGALYLSMQHPGLLVLLSLRYPTTHLLALVSNSRTHSDAALTPSSFTTLSNTTQIIALALISSVCGHFNADEDD